MLVPRWHPIRRTLAALALEARPRGARDSQWIGAGLHCSWGQSWVHIQRELVVHSARRCAQAGAGSRGVCTAPSRQSDAEQRRKLRTPAPGRRVIMGLQKHWCPVRVPVVNQASDGLWLHRRIARPDSQRRAARRGEQNRQGQDERDLLECLAARAAGRRHACDPFDLERSHIICNWHEAAPFLTAALG